MKINAYWLSEDKTETMQTEKERVAAHVIIRTRVRAFYPIYVIRYDKTRVEMLL